MFLKLLCMAYLALSGIHSSFKPTAKEVCNQYTHECNIQADFDYYCDRTEIQKRNPNFESYAYDLENCIQRNAPAKEAAKANCRSYSDIK